MRSSLTVLLLLVLFSCGSSVDENNETLNPYIGHDYIDLSPFGYDLAIYMPKEEDTGKRIVQETERGAIQILAGNSYGMELFFSEVDLSIAKQELESDMVFVNEIMEETDSYIVYKQDIPKSSVKTTYHFVYIQKIGEDYFEIRNLIEEDYSQVAIGKMVKVAESLQSITSESLAQV